LFMLAAVLSQFAIGLVGVITGSLFFTEHLHCDEQRIPVYAIVGGCLLLALGLLTTRLTVRDGEDGRRVRLRRRADTSTFHDVVCGLLLGFELCWTVYGTFLLASTGPGSAYENCDRAVYIGAVSVAALFWSVSGLIALLLLVVGCLYLCGDRDPSALDDMRARAQLRERLP